MSSAWATPLAHSLSKARGQNHCSARWTAPRLRTLPRGAGAGPGWGGAAGAGQRRWSGRWAMGRVPGLAGVLSGGSLTKSRGLAKVILSKQRNPGKILK